MIKAGRGKEQGYARTPVTITNNTLAPPPLPANRAAAVQGQQNQVNQNDGGYIISKGPITTMIQPMPKYNKKQKSISRQVNLEITSPLAYTEYLH
jgi:hypothetical protein